MPYLKFVLHSPRSGFTLSEAKDRLLRSISFEGKLTEHELSVADAGSFEHPESASVLFTEAPATAVPAGKIGYTPRWRDESASKTYPGCCAVHVGCALEVLDFLHGSRHGGTVQEQFHMSVYLQSGHPETVYLGGDELSWDPEKKNPLPLTVTSISLVPHSAASRDVPNRSSAT